MAQDRRHLSGKAKAAILLSMLGAEAAANILSRLRDREVEILTIEMGRRANVNKDVRRAVLDEFTQLIGGGELSGDGGMDFVREVLVKARGEEGAENVLSKIQAAIAEPGFEGLNEIDSDQLVNMIRNEHPQTIAVILSHLKSRLAGTVLAGLGKDIQAEVARRMARFNRVSTDLLKDVEQVLNQNFFVLNQGKSDIGGPKAVADVLNAVDGPTEKHILSQLDELIPDVASEIRRHMFAFEDILKLSDRDVQRVLMDVSTKTLSVSMKAASDSVKDHIYSNMSERARKMLQEEVQLLGPMRLRVVEEAQSEIVSHIRLLEQTGDVSLERGREEEDIYV